MRYHTDSMVQLLAAMASVVWGAVAANAADPAAAAPVVDASRFPNLQSAFDALSPAGGVVRIPPGVYEIERPLRITGEDVLIQGSGTATHIKNVNTTGASALEIVPPGLTDRGHPGENLVPRWRIQIADLRITGNPTSGHGIDALQVNEIFLHGVSVSEHGGDGVRLDHCYEDPRINDCLFTYNKAAGLNLLGCHDIVVSGCQFEENQDALRCVDGFNLCMTGNNIDDHLRHGVVIENTYGSVVSGNMIEECTGTAIILDRDCYGDTLSANVIAHNGAGVELLDAHGCAVSANTFTILKQRALYVGPQSGRITVTGNNFSNSFIGNEQLQQEAGDFAAAGITLEGTSDVAIVGNIFSGLTEKAITAIDPPSRRIAFTGNVLVDVAADLVALPESVVAGNVGVP